MNDYLSGTSGTSVSYDAYYTTQEGPSLYAKRNLEPEVDSLKHQNNTMQEIINMLITRIQELEMHMEYLKYKP